MKLQKILIIFTQPPFNIMFHISKNHALSEKCIHTRHIPHKVQFSTKFSTSKKCLYNPMLKSNDDVAKTISSNNRTSSLAHTSMPRHAHNLYMHFHHIKPSATIQHICPNRNPSTLLRAMFACIKSKIFVRVRRQIGMHPSEFLSAFLWCSSRMREKANNNKKLWFSKLKLTQWDNVY